MSVNYKIKLDDQVSAPAARVAAAFQAVASASERSAMAAQTQDAAYRAVAGQAERVARAELKAARAVLATEKYMARSSRTMGGRRTGAARGGGGGGGWLDDLMAGRSGGVSAVGAAISGVIGGAVVRLGRDFLEAAGDAQTLERTFSRIAPGELEETRALIQRLGLDLVEGERAALKLRTTFDKFTAGKFLEFFRGMNLDPGELDRATLAITQIQGRGKLQAEELNQFVEAVPGVDRGRVVDQISKEMSIARDEAAKKLQTGQVAADVGIRALVFAALESRKLVDPGSREYGGLSKGIEESSGDINVRLAAIDNSITRVKRNLGENLAQSGFLDMVERLASAVERLSKADFGIFDRLMGVFKTLNGDYSVPASKILGVDPESTLGRFLDYKPFGTNNQDNKGAQAAKRSAAEVGGNALDLGADPFGAQAGEIPLEFWNTLQGQADSAVSEAEMAAQTGAGVNQSHMTQVGSGAAAALSSTTNNAGNTIGAVNVNVTLEGGGQDAAGQVRDYFEQGAFVDLLERNLEGSGA